MCAFTEIPESINEFLQGFGWSVNLFEIVAMLFLTADELRCRSQDQVGDTMGQPQASFLRNNILVVNFVDQSHSRSGYDFQVIISRFLDHRVWKLGLSGTDRCPCLDG